MDKNSNFRIYTISAFVFSGILVYFFVAVQGAPNILSLVSLMISGFLLLFFMLLFGHSKFQQLLKQRLAKPVEQLIGLVLVIFAPFFIYAIGNKDLIFIALLEIVIYLFLPSLLLLILSYFNKKSYYFDLFVLAIIFFAFDHRLIKHIWGVPEGYSYTFNSLYLVTIILYDYLIIREISEINFSFIFGSDDVKISIFYLIPLFVILLPIALITGFVTPQTSFAPLYELIIAFIGIFLTIATVEELVFRGIVLNILSKITKNTKYALILSSIVFGLIHWDNTPIIDWRYIFLATIAGVFYGLSYLKKKKLLPSILLHTYVDTIWHYFFI